MYTQTNAFEHAGRTHTYTHIHTHTHTHTVSRLTMSVAMMALIIT